jgi:hypothetical protein
VPLADTEGRVVAASHRSWPGFDPRSRNVGFMVDEEAL